MTIEELKNVAERLSGEDPDWSDIEAAADALPALLAVAEAAKLLIDINARPMNFIDLHERAKSELRDTLAALETKEPKQ